MSAPDGLGYRTLGGRWQAAVCAGGAYVPTLVVGMYAPFGVVGVYHATIYMPWAFIVALWHVEDPTMGAYIATTGVTTYAPPANIPEIPSFLPRLD